MSYLTPDLTGQNELYKIDNHIFMVISNNQKLKFKGSVHADSIVLTIIETINTNMPKDIDWTILPEDIDYDNMAKMRLKDPTFKGTLCRQVTVIKPYINTDYKISAKYQRLYPVQGKMTLFNEEPIEFTPDMQAYVLRMIDYLASMITPIQNNHTPDIQNPWGLEEDPHLERAENFIVDEIHEVNAPNGKFFIHPLGGSFAKGTLKVIDLNTGNVMKSGIDYKAFGMQPHKTQLTDHEEGISEFIVFLKSYVGQVKIDYHAFGGDVTLTDHRIILEDLNNIITFIGQSQFVTYDNLKDAPIMASINSQYIKLQNEVKAMRALLSGRPSYSDASHGQLMKKRLMTNDTENHWWNVATLFKVDGSTDVITADVLKIRVRTNYTVFMFDAVISVNLNAPDKKMNVEILSPVYPKGYVPYQDYSGLNHIIRPQFRCIWNENTVEGSGVTLQIGLPLKTVAEEILVVENWSGPESCWMLEPSESTGQFPQDDVIQLPAGNHYWDVLNSDSRQETLLLPFNDGHIIWAGSTILNTTSGMQYNRLTHLLEKNIDIRNIRRISCDLTENPTGQYRVFIDVEPGSEDLRGSATFWYNGKPAYIVGEIKRNINGDIVVDINADITAGIASNPLALRHVHVYTN